MQWQLSFTCKHYNFKIENRSSSLFRHQPLDLLESRVLVECARGYRRRHRSLIKPFSLHLALHRIPLFIFITIGFLGLYAFLHTGTKLNIWPQKFLDIKIDFCAQNEVWLQCASSFSNCLMFRIYSSIFLNFHGGSILLASISLQHKGKWKRLADRWQWNWTSPPLPTTFPSSLLLPPWKVSYSSLWKFSPPHVVLHFFWLLSEYEAVVMGMKKEEGGGLFHGCCSAKRGRYLGSGVRLAVEVCWDPISS